MKGKLLLEDGKEFFGDIFGDKSFKYGEIVFNTGMTGYENSLTDPSYKGQVLVFTYPLIGNYGVCGNKKDENGIEVNFESSKIHVSGVVVANLSDDYSHYTAEKSFEKWLLENEVIGIKNIDTRELTQYIRDNGAMIGQILPLEEDQRKNLQHPNEKNLVNLVSTKEIKTIKPKNYNGINILIMDFGIKNNIIREFLKRGVSTTICPWNTDISKIENNFHALFLSNGPGNPETVYKIAKKNIDFVVSQNKPIFGICLGNQLLSLSFGAKIKKMQYGHRGANQPCMDVFSKKCFITSQNHGYVVDDSTLSKDFSIWFKNLNDNTVEGIKHKNLPIYSVQFHPESIPGPQDTSYLFNNFIEDIKKAC